jgi:hypothetical protein
MCAITQDPQNSAHTVCTIFVVLGYNVTMVHDMAGSRPDRFLVERIQTGVRIERRLLKVLKGLAEYLDLTLGDLLEGIVLHAFDGKCAFSPSTLVRIQDLKKFYGLDLNASASHRLKEAKLVAPAKKERRGK